MEQLLILFEEHKLSAFDFRFLNNWFGKKVEGRFIMLVSKQST